jgi:transcriptional regulator with XRE-family HTH domain
MPEHLGRVVRLLRAMRGWTQSELSFRSQVSQFLISRLETGRGRPGPGEIARLEKALGVSFDDPIRGPPLSGRAVWRHAAGPYGIPPRTARRRPRTVSRWDTIGMQAPPSGCRHREIP